VVEISVFFLLISSICFVIYHKHLQFLPTFSFFSPTASNLLSSFSYILQDAFVPRSLTRILLHPLNEPFSSIRLIESQLPIFVKFFHEQKFCIFSRSLFLLLPLQQPGHSYHPFIHLLPLPFLFVVQQ
jgi:hypothetical protein